MPTVRWFPRGPEYRHYFSFFERFGMAKKVKRYKKFILMLLLIKSNKRRRCELTSNERAPGNLAMIGFMRRIIRNKAIMKRRAVTVFHPPPGVVAHGVESTFWDGS